MKTMRKGFILLSMLLACVLSAGDITLTLVGNDPMTLRVRGDTQNEQAYSVSFYLYYNDDGITTLTTGGVDAPTLDGWGWPAPFETITITPGVYSKGGRLYTQELYYGHVDLFMVGQYWTTSGVDAVIIDFTIISPAGHVYLEVPSGGFCDQSSQPHNITYTNQDKSLPVEMVMMKAEATTEGIYLTWKTASELNSLGFHILRSETKNGEYLMLTTALIPGQGNSSSGARYTYLDQKNIKSGQVYYYKIQEIGMDGSVTEHGPIIVKTRDIPDQFEMSQNYPNPFNPVTTIRYQIAEPGFVSLKIYDLLGKEVDILVQEEKAAGIYDVEWNGKDLPSGIYIYQLVAGSITETRKLVLQK